jgi:two-component system, LuxR family, response regulator FixJ
MPSETATIFIVEDDESVRGSLKLLLESYGMRVEDYGSAREFVRNYQVRSGHCLILDQHLPDMTGLDFVASPEGARLDIPVILVTGRGDDLIRAKALQAGVAAYLEKPLDDGVLINTIREAIVQRG